jgi:cellulose synthase/poly-beta-1,6-N-acetylglucosamine synthase-like glycosyltransferase
VTQCPLTVLALLRQRSRWIWGTIQAAAFALAHILLKRPAQNRLPATIFVALTMLNIFGFLIALGAAYRAATMQLGWSDILAGSLLVAVTVIRIILTRKKEGYVDTGVVKVLALLAAMQVANITSFWCGLFTGRMIRFSW